MLKASYVKVCLAKCVENFLDMYFEDWNFSVAKKLIELQNFFFSIVQILELGFYMALMNNMSLWKYSGVIYHLS